MTVPWLNIFAAFVATYFLFGVAVVFNTPESIWAGVPRWQAILTWPLVFFGPNRR